MSEKQKTSPSPPFGIGDIVEHVASRNRGIVIDLEQVCLTHRESMSCYRNRFEGCRHGPTGRLVIEVDFRQRVIVDQAVVSLVRELS